eukprot:3907689-Karenia_brevis.AAC.1
MPVQSKFAKHTAPANPGKLAKRKALRMASMAASSRADKISIASTQSRRRCNSREYDRFGRKLK